MAIIVRRSIEPFSRGNALTAADSAGGTILIESDVYRLLKQEAERYVLGEIRGRSFLIAGHRGSGKTTTVLQVCQELRNIPPRPNIQVLPIFLHGPNLLPDPNSPRVNDQVDDPAAGAAGEGTQNGSDEKVTEEVDPPPAPAATRPHGALSDDETENALIQICLELYRAIAKELTARFRLDALTDPSGNDDLSPHQIDRLELAAQLELELDRCPDPARLREIWERSGFLPHGVLFPYEDEARGTVYARPPDQGFRELLALVSACEVYRRISGSVTKEEGRKNEESRESSSGIKLDTKGQDLLSGIASIITGGLAAVAASNASGEPGLIATAFTGVIAALGAAAVLNWARTRTRKASIVEESKFTRDLTLATLDREIPVLVDRCLDAGLVPLFIVDELDKVEGLSRRITSLVRRLKKLVAERAFFCFLADRSYFEEMGARTRAVPYSIEYTYFHHDLFVAFGHQDFHRYLLRALAPADGSVAFESTTTGAEQISFDPGAALKDLEDARILRYILLHQAKMHPIDLRRRMARLTDEQGNLVVPAGGWSSRANLCDLMIQVAVEIVLDGETMRERLHRTPRFRRLAHDALYSASRSWEEADHALDLSDAKEEEFGARLVARMGHDGSENGSNTEHSTQALPEDEIRFLLERTRELAHLLADPAAFRKAVLEWESRADSEDLAEDLRLTWATLESHAARVLPLLAAHGEVQHCYRWRLDYSGLPTRWGEVCPLTQDAPVSTLAPSETLDTVESLQALARFFDREVQVSLDELMGDLRILSNSPQWSEVQAALSRLTAASEDGSAATPEPEDLQVIQDFQALLVRERRVLALALLCGRILGQASGLDSTSARLKAGLRAISRVHRFDKLVVAAKEQQLAEIWAGDGGLEAMATKVAPRPTTQAVEVLFADSWRDWLSSAEAIAARYEIDGSFLSRQRNDAWKEWVIRLGFLRENPHQAFPPHASELWCSAAGISPTRLLLPDLGALTLRQCSIAFLAGVLGNLQEKEDFPGFAAIIALFRLGFASSASGWLESTLSDSLRECSERKVSLLSVVRERVSVHAFLVAEADFRTRHPRALLIRADGASMTHQWMPPRRGGAIALTWDEFENHLVTDETTNAKSLLSLLQVDIVVVELEAEQQQRTTEGGKRSSAYSKELGLRVEELRLALNRSNERRNSRHPQLTFIAADSSVPVPTHRPVLYAPGDIDEVLEKISRSRR